MGFYIEHVLPRVINLLMAHEPFAQERRACLADVSGTVLEIGFGTGLNLPHYPPEVRHLFALDRSELGRKLARERMARAPFPVDFVAGNAERVGLASESVDNVVTTWTLCTIPDPAKALSEIRRVLRVGGRYHFVEHGRSPEERVARWQERLNPIQKVIGGGCHLNRRIDRIICDSGLALERFGNGYMIGPKIGAYLYRGMAVKR